MAAPEPPTDTQPTLLGRERELNHLWAQFQQARQGRLQVVLLSGDPGIGKSRLLQALAAQAGRAGALVWQGGASEAEGMPPYLPFLEALSPYIRTAPLEILHAQSGPLTSILATIFPELTLRLGESAPGYALPPEQARLRLFEAVSSFLAAAAASPASGGVLILDDLHWADPASLDLLCYLARRQSSASLLIVGAYRAGEAAYPAAFEHALTELTRLRRLTTLTLSPLAPTAITSLAAAYLQAPLAPKLSQLLYTQSEGNPFLAEELLRGWQETGQVEPSRSGWQWRGQPGEMLPASIIGAVRQRLTRLPAPTLETLRSAAITGRTFEAALLAQVVEQEEEAVEEALQAAIQARLIQPGKPGVFTFSHDAIRQCLYQEVTAARRKRLHGAIGRALEARPPQAGAQRLAELAFHFSHSGDSARAVAYARQAAEGALQTYAYAEAAVHYHTALNLLGLADPQRGRLLLSLGEATLLAGQEREAAAAFESAQSWFSQAGDPAAAALAAHRLGQAFWRLESLPEARQAFEMALRLLRGLPQPQPRLIQVLGDLGSLLVVSLHQQGEGLAYGQQALELAHQLEDDRLVAAASRTYGNLLVRANYWHTGLPLLERALALAMEQDDPVEAAECYACLTIAYAWSAAAQRVFALIPHWLEAAQRSHDLYHLRHIYSMQAIGHIFGGRWAEAEQVLAQAQAVVEQLASPEPAAFLEVIHGMMAYYRGDYAAAEAALVKATASLRAIGPGALVWYLGWLGMAQAAQGKREAAQACRAELEMLLTRLPVTAMPTAEALAHLTMLALSLEDQESLTRYYGQLEPFRGQFHDALVDRLLGTIEIYRRDWPAAQASLAAAETVARREGFKIELAQTLAAQAELALVEGRAGRPLLDQAIALFRELGNAPEVERLRRRQQDLSSPPSPSFPAGLSQREVEVLRLVAAGKSNRQIAQALVLSEKTVANHLTHIFNKTGADNRAAAAAFALRHNLV